MLLGNSQKEETNKAIIRRLYSLLFFFTLFTALYMKGRYIIMKNLKKTIKDVKYNEMDVLLRVGLFAAGVLMEVGFIYKVNKVINNMTKK